jgi:hypothetical protein
MDSRRQPQGISPVIGAMLLAGMTVVLSAIVYVLVAGLPIMAQVDPAGFQYISITTLRLGSGEPYPLCDNCIILLHRGNRALKNDDLSAIVLSNGATLAANISTLNGQKYSSTAHAGLHRLGGPGSREKTWDPGEEIWLDLKAGLIREGDLVTVRIIHKPSHLVISEDTAQA